MLNGRITLEDFGLVFIALTRAQPQMDKLLKQPCMRPFLYSFNMNNFQETLDESRVSFYNEVDVIKNVDEDSRIYKKGKANWGW